MAFFDDSFMKNKDNDLNDENNEFDEGITTSNSSFSTSDKLNTNITTSTELEVNRKNREAYENLMENSKTSYDSYYDKNNIFTKIVLFSLLLIIIGGFVYYLLMYLSR